MEHFRRILTHVSHNPTGPDTVIVSHPALVVRVLPSGQYVLETQIVRPLIQNPGPILHANRVTMMEIGVKFWTVPAAFIILPQEFPIFIKDDLQIET